MDSLLTSAASGMRARMESLDLLANNVANTSTAAFKADREMFGLYVSEQADPGQQTGVTESPVIEKHWTDFSQGVLKPTGNPLDFGISGKGFFVLDSAGAAATDAPRYTRNGSFHIGRGGQLETSDGWTLRVKTPDDLPLRLDAARPVDVSQEGIVSQDNRTLGTVQIADIDAQSPVSKLGSTYFQWRGDAPGPNAVATPEVHQGTLESSNVPVAESAVRLVSVMRQFEMLQRAVSLGGDMNRRALEEVTKVS